MSLTTEPFVCLLSPYLTFDLAPFANIAVVFLERRGKRMSTRSVCNEEEVFRFRRIEGRRRWHLGSGCISASAGKPSIW